MLMADAGADVIKIERPGGDSSRSTEPTVPVGGAEIGAVFLRMNRNKRSVTLDLKSTAGRNALGRLIAKADVLVENFSVGVLERLGFDKETLDELNPQLVYCSISGFGHSPSVGRKRPAFNLIAEYEAGVYVRPNSGGAPAPLGPYVGDLFPAMHALSGVLMALHRRSTTGLGARVDIAMFDSMLSFNEAAASNGTWLEDGSAGDLSSLYCPSGVFGSQDGFVCIDLVTDAQWESLCTIIGRRDLYAMPELSTGPRRSSNYEMLLAQPLGSWLTQHDSEHIVSRLNSQGVPAAVVRKPGEALTGVQAAQRNMCVEVGPGGGPGLKVPASPIRIDDKESPTFAVIAPPGQHTVEVLSELAGMSATEIQSTQDSQERQHAVTKR